MIDDEDELTRYVKTLRETFICMDSLTFQQWYMIYVYM